jgi:hypothetical protein
MKNHQKGKVRKIPIEFGLSGPIAMAMAGTLNDWKSDSVLMSALGEHAGCPHSGRRGAEPSCGEQ